MAEMYVEDTMDGADSDVTHPSIDDILEASDNVAVVLEGNFRDSLAKQVLEDYTLDRETMSEWLRVTEKAIELASQDIKIKTEPWQGAANVKHAIILEACIQFSARAYPEIVRDAKVVKTRVVGEDKDGSKAARALRIENHMNYQLMDEMSEWDGDLDRMLHVLSMVGTVFKKTYYCPIEKRNVSEMCLPHKVTINQAVQNLETARRITHEIELYPSQIIERIREGVFLDVDLDEVPDEDQPFNDQPHIFFEQKRFLDLDGDGYPEPYIVTVHETSQQLVRITPCFAETSIEYTDKLEVKRITSDQYFADFHFIHTIDGTYYSYGFGYLLSHATQTINTLLNQIIDAGSMSTLQSGFYGKGARIKGGTLRFRPGEWKKADASGFDLKNSIVPLPAKEPSNVLLNLVQFLLNSYYKMVSISDIMSGQISSSNTTAAESLSAVEQGMKVNNSIYKRIYRGLAKEFKQLSRLNRDYLADETYFNILDQSGVIAKADYETEGVNVFPVADASMSTQFEQMARARAGLEAAQTIPEMQRIPLGRVYLKALKYTQEEIDEILPQEDPNDPSQQQQEFQAELEQRAQDLNQLEQELQIKKFNLELQAIKDDFTNAKVAADTQLALAKAEQVDSSIDLDTFLAQVRDLESKAKFIQAVTPDNGEAKSEDSKRAVSRVAGPSDNSASKDEGGTA